MDFNLGVDEEQTLKSAISLWLRFDDSSDRRAKLEPVIRNSKILDRIDPAKGSLEQLVARILSECKVEDSVRFEDHPLLRLIDHLCAEEVGGAELTSALLSTKMRFVRTEFERDESTHPLIRVFTTWCPGNEHLTLPLLETLERDSILVTWRAPITNENGNQVFKTAELSSIHVIFWSRDCLQHALLLRLIYELSLKMEEQGQRVLILVPLHDDVNLPSRLTRFSLSTDVFDRSRVVEDLHSAIVDAFYSAGFHLNAPYEVVLPGVEDTLLKQPWIPRDTAAYILEMLDRLRSVVTPHRSDESTDSAARRSWRRRPRADLIDLVIDQGFEHFGAAKGSISLPLVALRSVGQSQFPIEMHHAFRPVPLAKQMLVVGDPGHGLESFAQLILWGVKDARKSAALGKHAGSRDVRLGSVVPIVISTEQLCGDQLPTAGLSDECQTILLNQESRSRCWVIIDAREASKRFDNARVGEQVDRLQSSEALAGVEGWILLAHSPPTGLGRRWKQLDLKGVFLEEIGDQSTRQRLASLKLHSSVGYLTVVMAERFLSSEISDFWESIADAHYEQFLTHEIGGGVYRERMLRIIIPRVLADVMEDSRSTTLSLSFSDVVELCRSDDVLKPIGADQLWEILSVFPGLFIRNVDRLELTTSWFTAGFVARALESHDRIDPKWTVRTPFHESVLAELQRRLRAGKRWPIHPLVELAMQSPMKLWQSGGHGFDFSSLSSSPNVKTIMSSFLGPLICTKLDDRMLEPEFRELLSSVDRNWRSAWAFEQATRTDVQWGDEKLKLLLAAIDTSALSTLIDWNPGRAVGLARIIDQVGVSPDILSLCRALAEKAPDAVTQGIWRGISIDRLISLYGS